MKQLIIGVVLAVLLVGCVEKSKFSINETNNSETYANNQIFTKVKVSIIINGKDNGEGIFGYQFTNTPISVFDIETGDLNVIGGVVTPAPANRKGMKDIIVTLTMKGKESFDKLEKRLNELKGITCDRINIGNTSNSINCNIEQQQSIGKLSVSYNSFSNISSFMYIKH